MSPKEMLEQVKETDKIEAIQVASDIDKAF